MYGIAAVRYKGKDIGYIEKSSWDMGGKKPEATKIEAEQVPGAPVLVIPQSNGTISPTFNMIQLNYANLQALLGGTLHYKDAQQEVISGWTPPVDAEVISGPWEIATASGQSILIPSATLLSNLGGKLTLTETAKIECNLEVTAPEQKGIPPFGVFNCDDLPAEWEQFSLPAKAE